MSIQIFLLRSTVRWFLYVTLLVGVIFTPFSWCPAQQYIYTPSAFADTEADGTQEIPGVFSYRLQQVYDASEFEALGSGPWTITRVDWRVDATITEPISYPSDQWIMTMSTTSAEPGALQAAFAENVGDDEVTVINGPVTLTSAATGPPEGPRVFDYGVDFETPFSYDPSEGNLLMDLKVFNGQGPLWMDFTFTPPATTSLISTVLLGVDSPVADLSPPTGGQWGGHIARFTVVPEPSGLLLALSALVLTLFSRRRLSTRFGPHPAVFIVLLSITVLASTTVPLVGQEFTVVAPNALEDAEGDRSSETPTTALKYQFLFLASEFDAVPEGGAWIIGHALRADASQSTSLPSNFADALITLSTTTSSSLTTSFADNLGEDAVTVLNKSVELDYPISGPPGGPNPFGDDYAYETPFFYDPSQGNLVVEFVSSSGSDTPGAYRDWANTPGLGGMVYSYNATATHGDLAQIRAVTRFTFIPEPSGAVLAGLGFAFVLTRRRGIA